MLYTIVLDQLVSGPKMANCFKSKVREEMRAALETAAEERYPGGYRIDEEDFEKFVKRIGIEETLQAVNSLTPSNAHPSPHQLHLTVQAGFKIHMYPSMPVKKGAAIGGGVGAVAGVAGGAAGGVAAGALIGSVVPIAGTIIGGIIGGILGGVGGGLAGGGVGAGVGAGGGVVHSRKLGEFIFASEVFVKFDNYSCDSNHSICHCTLTVQTDSGHQEE